MGRKPEMYQRDLPRYDDVLPARFRLSPLPWLSVQTSTGSHEQQRATPLLSPALSTATAAASLPWQRACSATLQRLKM